MSFGELVQKRRLGLRQSLRAFCMKNSVDPSNWSKMERGVIPPPQNQDKLKEYASYLDIEFGTDDWYNFSDAAAADKGIIPKDLMSDEELVSALPLFFRTIRNEKPTKEELLEFAEHLRKHP